MMYCLTVLILTNRNADSGPHDRTAKASLTCEEEVTSFDITIVEADMVTDILTHRHVHTYIISSLSLQMVQVGVVSQEGCVHLFSFALTNHLSAPVTAHSTVMFVTKATKVHTVSLIARSQLLSLFFMQSKKLGEVWERGWHTVYLTSYIIAPPSHRARRHSLYQS